MFTFCLSLSLTVNEQPRPTLFGDMTEDASGHDYIALRLRVAGEPQTHNSYYVNIQTTGPISTDLWQHRLFFQKGDGSWEDIYASAILAVSPHSMIKRVGVQIPFDSFVRTNYGEMSENQMSMLRERIRSIGISILGGNSRVEGKYELGIDSVQLVNEEDIESPLGATLNQLHKHDHLTCCRLLERSQQRCAEFRSIFNSIEKISVNTINAMQYVKSI